MKGYKALSKNMASTYGDFVYEVGKTYVHDGLIALCESGFHFCANPADCFGYYPLNGSRLFEVEADGSVVTSEDKSVCSRITLVRELDDDEIQRLINSGEGNFGIRNSGDQNNGDKNSGRGNSGKSNSGNNNGGEANSGDWNYGKRNSGDRNSGCGNSGDWNYGDRNSGSFNKGSGNSGDWNITNYSSEVLCTEEPECLIFDKPSGMTLKEWRETDAARLLRWIEVKQSVWRSWDSMTADERNSLSEVEACGGVVMLPEDIGKPDFAGWWDGLTEEERDIIKAIPYFDAEKWRLITGIEV